MLQNSDTFITIIDKIALVRRVIFVLKQYRFFNGCKNGYGSIK